MKNTIGLVAVGLLLTACGGGGGGSNGGNSGSVGGGSTTPPVTTPPPVTVTPEVKVLSGTVVRYAAEGSGVAFNVQIKPNFTPAGTLFVTASDTAAVISPTVVVTPNTDGSYSLALGTTNNPASGHYTGNITLKLCADAECTKPQSVASVTVPYDLNVVAYGSAWPGDKLTALTPWTDVPDWSTFQGNPAHTGYVPVEIKPEQVLPRWKAAAISQAAVQSFGYGYSATLTAANGLFFGAGANVLKARKEHDGSVAWSYDLSSLMYPSVNPPAVANGIVYMAGGQQSSTFMFAFEAATGAVKFKSPMSSQWENYLAPVALDDAVYTNGGMYGGLYAFKSTGEQMFFTSNAQTSMWSPAVDANSVYVYTNNTLTVQDRKTGAVQSTIKDVNGSQYYTYQANGAPVLGASGSVFAANYGSGFQNSNTGNELLKFNTAKGYIDWRIKGNYPLTPAYASGVVYVQNLSPYRIEARSEGDGAVLWSWVPGAAAETGWSGEPVVTKNLVFVSATKATYAIDLTSHKVVWSYPMAGRLALTRSGILYIQNQEAVVAFNVK